MTNVYFRTTRDVKWQNTSDIFWKYQNLFSERVTFQLSTSERKDSIASEARNIVSLNASERTVEVL
jgi:hypothetical protein